MEAHIAELDIAFDGLPVFLFREKAVSVLLDNLRGIHHLGLFVQKAGDTLDVGLGGNELRQVPRHLLNRLEDAHCISREGRERTDQHGILKDLNAASREDDGRRQRAAEKHQWQINGVEPCRPY